MDGLDYSSPNQKDTENMPPGARGACIKLESILKFILITSLILISLLQNW